MHYLVALWFLLILLPASASGQDGGTRPSSYLDACLRNLGVTYDYYSQNMAPNPILTAYRWRATRKAKQKTQSSYPGRMEFTKDILTGSGSFEPTDEIFWGLPESGMPGDCIPMLKGINEGTVQWVVESTGECSGNDEGMVSFSEETMGYLRKDWVMLFFGAGSWTNVTYQWTERCPFGSMTHESDVQGVSNWGHAFQYRDGAHDKDVFSNPSIDINIKFEYQFEATLTAECPLDTSRPSALLLNITANMPPVTYNHTLSGSEIKALKEGPTTLLDNAGLTKVRYDPSPLDYISASISARFGNRRCVWAHQINLDLSYPWIKLYIAREYPLGSCNYSVTLAHEQEHLTDAKQLLKKYQEKIQDALRKAPIPHEYLPYPAASEAEAEEDIEAMIKTISEPIMDAFHEELIKKRSDRDTPENIERVHQQCPNW